jgi:hypothetical protein
LLAVDCAQAPRGVLDSLQSARWVAYPTAAERGTYARNVTGRLWPLGQSGFVQRTTQRLRTLLLIKCGQALSSSQQWTSHLQPRLDDAYLKHRIRTALVPLPSLSRGVAEPQLLRRSTAASKAFTLRLMDSARRGSRAAPTVAGRNE